MPRSLCLRRIVFALLFLSLLYAGSALARPASYSKKPARIRVTGHTPKLQRLKRTGAGTFPLFLDAPRNHFADAPVCSS